MTFGNLDPAVENRPFVPLEVLEQLSVMRGAAVVFMDAGASEGVVVCVHMWL